MVEGIIRVSLMSAVSLGFSSIFQTPTFNKCILFNVSNLFKKWL